MDRGAFTRVLTGRWHMDVRRYALYIDDVACNGQLVAAVAQDYMCEPFILNITGLSVSEHQSRTVERYTDLLQWIQSGTYIMPVLQGYAPEEYAQHIEMYGKLLSHGAWVGVGSVCKRNRYPGEVLAVLEAIATVRPDLRLHLFGVKKTALALHSIRNLSYSADSLASSYAARRARFDGDLSMSANDPMQALQYAREIESLIGAES